MMPEPSTYRDELRDLVADAVRTVHTERGRDCDACVKRADAVLAAIHEAGYRLMRPITPEEEAEDAQW